MRKLNFVYTILIGFIVLFTTSKVVHAQRDKIDAKLFIGGGALPEEMYAEFLKLTGPDTKLVVVPTASSREVDEEKIKELWQSRGFSEISVLHTRDPKIASEPEFSESLRNATALWFNGGSQQRIADAYLGTGVENEVYELLKRGGVVGGSSAGAAIMTRVMISGGQTEPEITTGFELLPNALLDQHFLRRNRLARLIAGVRAHPDLIGYGIDEGTAIVVANNEYKVVGNSYVMRIELVDGAIKIDAYEDGEVIPQI